MGQLLRPFESMVQARSLREFYPGGSQPADVLGYIQDGLAWSASDGGALLIPGDIEEPWTVSEPIVPPPNSRMIAGNAFNRFSERLGDTHGSAFYQLPPTGDKIGEAWVRLANGVNGPILYNDYTNAEGKRGPARGNGGYWQSSPAIGITFDHNGRNQSGSLIAIDIRDAWGMNFPYCRLVAPRGLGWVLDNCNDCNAEKASVLGDTENVANGTGDLASSVTISNASGTWAIGDLIAGTGIPASTYLTNVVGSTLTLSAAATVTASGQALTKPTPIATSLLVMRNTTTDCEWAGISMHNGKTANVLIDSAFGNRISGMTGYTVGGHNLRLSDSYASGTYANKLDLRTEQATKHNCRIDSGVHDNHVSLEAYSPGMFNTPSDADAGWANVFCDGKANVIEGVGLRALSLAPVPAMSCVVAYGPNAQDNKGLMTGGSDLAANTALYNFRPTSASAPGVIYSNTVPGPTPFVIPGKDFLPVDGTAAAVVNFNGTLHKVLSLVDAATSTVLAYCTIPYGVRKIFVRPLLVNLNSGVSGNVTMWVGIGDILGNGGQTFTDVEQNTSNTAVAIGANQQAVATSLGGATLFNVVPGDIVQIKIKRVGADAADTLAADIGLLAVRIEPQLAA
jgi:hypothetical protein